MFRDAPRSSRVLCISGSLGFAEILGLGDADLVGADFPKHSLLDLKAFRDESFDFIVSDQVLEHVEGNPALAFKESHRVLKPGGITVHTTCFINPIHNVPVDLWRFTPYALRHLASDFSQIIKCGGWGNRAVWIIDAIGMRTTPVPHATWHPLHKMATANNELWPVTTWIVARK